MKGCGTLRDRTTLSAADRRELRHFERFLKLKDRHLARMLTRPRWQRYLGLTAPQAADLANTARLPSAASGLPGETP